MRGIMRRPWCAARFVMFVCLVFVSCCATANTAFALSGRFGTEGTGAGQISSEPQGIAVDQATGDVYIADRNNNRIDRFNFKGEFMLAWGWGVADGKSKELQTCTTTCFAGLEGAGAGEFASLSAEGIAVDNDLLSLSHGDVYVVDANNMRVQKFSATGQFVTMFGGEVNASTKANICPASEAAFCQAGVEGAGPGLFEGLNGRSIAVDSTGVVYLGDRNRMQRFSEEGAQESEAALPGVGRIQNLAVDSAKDIYLWGGLQEGPEGGVHKYDPTGTELGTPRDPAGFPEALAITIGPADELLVNDVQETHHILAFDSEGKQTSSFDAGEESARRGIAYSEFAKAIYAVAKGAVRIVTPPPPGPFLLPGTEKASGVEPTKAEFEATINPEGGEETKCHFEYGTTTVYGQETSGTELTEVVFADQLISAPVEGLSPSTTYHFRAVCENAAKEATTGEDQTFTTLPPISIDSTSASQITATSALLEAELNPHGVASDYRFEYGQSTAYGESVPIPNGSVGSATSDTRVENAIQELAPQTTYHYRVVAHNSLGTVTGPDRSLITEGPSSILADGRIWEMVSPPNKHGAPLEPLTEEGGLIQAAAGGGAFAYVALGPVNGEEAEGVRSPHDTQLLANRSSTGWSTQDISTPHEEVSIIHVGTPSEYKFFSDSLTSSVVEPEGITRLSPKTTEHTPYRRESDGEFVPLVTSENVPRGTSFGGHETQPGNGLWAGGVEFRTATPDLGHEVLVSPQILAPGFKAGFEPEGRQSVYGLFSGTLTLISVLPNGQPAAEAGLGAGVGGMNLRGVISNDGDRIVFGTSDEALYLRDATLRQTLRLDELQPGAEGGGGVAIFQVASSDGKRVFFTDASRLTTHATATPTKPDLYMCEVGESEGHLFCALSDLSVDLNPGEAADVQDRVSAIDALGDHVYFAANGVLTSTPNARGERAVPGSCAGGGESSCNLYEYNTNTHQIILVAVLSSGDAPDWTGQGGGFLSSLTARSALNGHYLTFMSQRSLTGYDNRDTHSGEADEEVFQYDAQSGALICISCNPTGERPNGVFDPNRDDFPGLLVDHAHSWQERWVASSIPGWTLESLTVSLYQSRYLSDSGREFFNSSDALVPQDKNEVNDVYEFEPPGVGDCKTSSSSYSLTSGGCVSLISSGGSKEESAFLDASESGDEAFFLTSSRLRKADVDTAFDVYDAHVCSASSPCPPDPPEPPAECQGDSCQHPVPPRNETTPGTLTYKGPQNPPPPAKQTAKPPTKAQLLVKALKACKKKHPKKKRLTCERQARKKYGPKKGKKASTHRSAHARKGRGGR